MLPYILDLIANGEAASAASFILPLRRTAFQLVLGEQRFDGGDGLLLVESRVVRGVCGGAGGGSSAHPASPNAATRTVTALRTAAGVLCTEWV